MRWLRLCLTSLYRKNSLRFLRGPLPKPSCYRVHYFLGALSHHDTLEVKLTTTFSTEPYHREEMFPAQANHIISATDSLNIKKDAAL